MRGGVVPLSVVEYKSWSIVFYEDENLSSGYHFKHQCNLLGVAYEKLVVLPRCCLCDTELPNQVRNYLLAAKNLQQMSFT